MLRGSVLPSRGLRLGERDRMHDGRLANLFRIFSVVAACSLTLGACAMSPPTVSGLSSVDPKTGTSASPRLFSENDRIPKGGGTYKVGSPYVISGTRYTPREQPNYDQIGVGSWYGKDFHGRKTANGEIFDMNALTAAHPTLPMPSYAYVTNMDNGRTILVRINDRGPYVGDRIIDLSRRSAHELGYHGKGLTRVRVRYAGPAPLDGYDGYERRFLAQGSDSMRARVATAPAPLSNAPVRSVRLEDTGSGQWSVDSYRTSLAGRQGRNPSVR